MAQTFNTSLKNVAVQYARLRKLKITTSSIKTAIEENAYYPSLLSLSDTFTKFKVTNNGFKVDKESFEQLELPVVAYYYVPDVGKDFVMVTDITETTVSFIYGNSKKKTVTKQDFLNNYQEVIWMADPDENSIEPGFVEKNNAERKLQLQNWGLGLLGILLFLIIVFANVNNTNLLAFSPIVLLKVMGLSITLLLLMYDINKSNAFIKNICSGGTKTNCDAVLDSKAAKMGNFSWSEAGFFYFAATTVFLLIPLNVFANKITGLAIASALAAPYILFSIYYQWRVVKNWCRLCLAVQLVLLLELIWSVPTYWQSPIWPVFDAGLVLSIIFSMTLPIAIWYTLKPVLKKANDANGFSAAYKRLRYHPDVFNSLLKQQAKAPDGWQGLGITIGNANAANHIIKVCNPYCGPCAEAHGVLEELLHNKNIKLTILFNVTNNESDIAAKPVKHLLAIATDNNEIKTKKALDDWYFSNSKEYDDFAKKYPMNGALKEQRDKIEEMRTWCLKADITYTPTIYLNGYRLPENYLLEELKMIISQNLNTNAKY